MKKLGLVVAVALAAEISQGAIIFDDTFGGFTDGALSGQGNWASQTPFNVASGAITYGGSDWARASRYGGFRVEDGQTAMGILASTYY